MKEGEGLMRSNLRNNSSYCYTVIPKDASITFVGHSKGGAEAVANSFATGRNAIVFNPAELMSFWYIGSSRTSGDIQTFIVNTDILDHVKRGTFLRFIGRNSSNGELTRLGRPDNRGFDFLSRSLSEIGISFGNHSIAAVIEALQLAGFDNDEEVC